MGTSARIDELRKKFDENPRRYFAPLANEYRKAGDLDQAIFICQEYLPQQPGHMSGHIVFGQALYESGRTEEAKAVFETALSLDPENLIALRHLGDIARGVGDLTGARAWYQRVLDTDPRNDEIMQLLSSLDSESPAAPAAVASDASAEGFTAATAAVETSRDSEGLAATRFEDASETPEIEKSQEALPITFGYGERNRDDSSVAEHREMDLPPVPPSQPVPAAATTSDDDLLDLDDFSFAGLQNEMSAPSAPVEEPAPIGLDGDVNISGGFTFGTEHEQFEPEPLAAPTPAPEIEPATDIKLGLTEEIGPPRSADVKPAALSGLETFEAGVIAHVPTDVPTLATEGFFDVVPVEEKAGAPTVEYVPVDGGHDGHEVPESIEQAQSPTVPGEDEMTNEPSAAEPAEVFVTETMAELYIQQGHLDSALDIYRKLVEQRPDEPELQDRLRAIEDWIFGAPADVAASPPSPEEGGATIREFLLGLVSRRPSSAGTGLQEEIDDRQNGSQGAGRESRMTPGASETVTGSIDALFSGADPSVSDAVAANALAAAFADTAPEPASPETTPLDGTPAHRAHDELSLDHVFKANTPPRERAGTNGFSFDEFFADEMTDAAAQSSGDSAQGSPEATDDIAQFNDWLNGLKKT